MAEGIREWLDGLGLGKYSDVFAENEVGLRDLPGISDDDLKELKLPLGPRRRILMAMEASEEPPTTLNVPRPEAERRLLTVMFCDLVGSTALSRRLDREDLRDVIRSYQDAVTNAVTSYGGHVAKYLGDGVLAYIGWPRAYEDQAERAVRAGLEAVQAVAAVYQHGQAIAARIGISTCAEVIGIWQGASGRSERLAAK